MKSSTSNADKIVFAPLRSDIELLPDKDKDCWLLFDPVADKYYKIGRKEHTVLSLFTEASSAEQLLEKVSLIDNSIKRANINEVITFLHANNLMRPVFGLTESRVRQMTEIKKKNRLNILLQSYLFFKIPLLRPDKFLTETQELVSAIFNKWLLLVLGLFSVCGYILLIVRWQKFESTVLASLNYAGMLKYGITIILLKVVHELAHAYTAKNAGIRVRSFGIGFIVFFPRFFTDITDSWRLTDRKQKLLIDSAGILSELLVGGIAVVFWAYSGPGVIQNISYYLFTVSIINTVLINGNPFIRYDGYYILMDLVNIDNLMMKSRLLIRKLVRENFFGIKTDLPFHFPELQKKLIILYGVSSFIYRIFLYTGIIMIIYYKFTKIVGIILMLLEIYILVIKPFQQEAGFIMKSIGKARRKNVLATSAGIFAVLFIFFAPLPWTVSLPCQVGSMNDNIIYVQTPGFLREVNTSHDKTVDGGSPLFVLANPFLEYDNDMLNKELKIKETELDQIKSQSGNDIRESSKSKTEQIEYIRNSINENVRKLKNLTITSPFKGTFVIFDRRLKPGKWLEYGDVLGEVFSDETPLVYAYAEETDSDLLKVGEKVKFSLNDCIKCFKGEIIGINPVPSKEWAPSPLLESSGGPLPVLKKEYSGNYLLKNYYYQITIKPENSDGSLKFARTGIVQSRKYSSIGLNFLRALVSTVQKEFSF